MSNVSLIGTVSGQPLTRHRQSEELKARVVLAACAEPGASVPVVAQAHGLNANLVHKWRRGRGALRAPSAGEGAPLKALTPPLCANPA